MFIVDSSVWVSLFLDFDVNHEESVLIFEQLIWTKIVMPYCVINEVCSVLAYKWGKEIANSFCWFIRNNNDIFIENNNILEEMEFFIWIDKKVSFTDLAVIKMAIDHWLGVITFDKQMKQIFTLQQKNKKDLLKTPKLWNMLLLSEESMSEEKIS